MHAKGRQEMTQQMNAAVGDWLRANLITIVIILGGFVATVWQLKGDVSTLQMQQTHDIADLRTQLNTLNTTVNQIQSSQIDEKLSYKGLSDEIDAHTKDIDGINKHLQAVDSTAANVKDSMATILSNQQLINQQIQFLSTQKSFIGSGQSKR